MNLIDLVFIALVAIISGVIGQLTSSYSKGGWIVYPIIGFFGAIAGVWISRSLNAPIIFDLKIGTTKFPIVYCFLGAVFFLAAIGFFVKPGRR